MTHEIEWRTASPLWPTSLETLDAIQRPALLRFTSDRFMDDLIALLTSEPGSLSQYVAKADPLKLFQPVHGEFNLVAASLVCRTLGLPDRAINLSTDKIGFVLRRIIGATLIGDDEYAWMLPKDPKQAPSWQLVKNRRTLEKEEKKEEEIIPLFPLSFVANGRKRRIFAGLIPTSSRESFVAADALNLMPTDAALQSLNEEIDGQIVAQLKVLKENKGTTASDIAIEASLFLLLDLALFLEKNLNSAWLTIKNGSAPAGVLYEQMNKKVDSTTTLYNALKAVYDQQKRIIGEESPSPTVKFDLSQSEIVPVDLGKALNSALAQANDAKPYTLPSDSTTSAPKFSQNGGERYVLRCVYQRNCKPIPQTSVSERSVPFALASFFDPDAPARTIRIVMPVDTTQAGLRKFKKSVGFLLSDQLRAQLDRVSDAKAALKGELSSEQPLNIGVLCSFSIPIITICALIVLMIFLNLLNIIFWWLPLLRICFPINLKVKGGS